jgi:deoxyribodipyrimidine photolyase
MKSDGKGRRWWLRNRAQLKKELNEKNIILSVLEDEDREQLKKYVQIFEENWLTKLGKRKRSK